MIIIFQVQTYILFIKEEYLDKFSYEYLVGILNSSVYDKYFKITKKMSKIYMITILIRL